MMAIDWSLSIMTCHRAICPSSVVPHAPVGNSIELLVLSCLALPGHPCRNPDSYGFRSSPCLALPCLALPCSICLSQQAVAGGD